MWQLVTAAPGIATAYQQLRDEYDVEPELLPANLDELLAKLVDNGLLRIVSSDVETPSAI
jgi:hypothetical protein